MFFLRWYDELNKAGLDFVKNEEWSGPHKDNIVLTSEKNKSLISYDRPNYYHDHPFQFQHIYIISPYPKPSFLLSKIENFEEIYNSFFKKIEKVIRAIYGLQGKTLPPTKLQLTSVESESREFLATCSFCRSNYFTAQNLRCPQCGASNPHFLIED